MSVGRYLNANNKEDAILAIQCRTPCTYSQRDISAYIRRHTVSRYVTDDICDNVLNRYLSDFDCYLRSYYK